MYRSVVNFQSLSSKPRSLPQAKIDNSRFIARPQFRAFHSCPRAFPTKIIPGVVQKQRPPFLSQLSQTMRLQFLNGWSVHFIFQEFSCYRTKIRGEFISAILPLRFVMVAPELKMRPFITALHQRMLHRAIQPGVMALDCGSLG